MTDLHPNWQATDIGGDPVNVHAAVPEKEDSLPEPDTSVAPTQSLTRQPAAIAGILLVISFGMAIYYGRSALMGSGMPGTVTIHIQETGLVPQSVRVAQGATVTWVNDTDQPQALASNELCTTSRACLSTGPIAAGGSASLAIAGDFASGVYHYYSVTAQGTEGVLTVTPSSGAEKRLGAQANLETALPLDEPTNGAASSESSMATDEPEFVALADNASSSEEAVPPPANGGVLLLTEAEAAASSGDASDVASSSSAPAVDPSVSLPTNPYAVGGVRQIPDSSQTDGTLHGGAPLPLSQPETGPGLWVAGLMALGLLFLLSRKSHRIQ